MIDLVAPQALINRANRRAQLRQEADSGCKHVQPPPSKANTVLDAPKLATVTEVQHQVAAHFNLTKLGLPVGTLLTVVSSE